MQCFVEVSETVISVWRASTIYITNTNIRVLLNESRGRVCIMHQHHLSRFLFLFVSFLCSLFIFVIWILIVNYRVYDNFVVLIQPCLLIIYRGMSNLQFNHLYSYIKVCLIQHKWLYITHMYYYDVIYACTLYYLSGPKN